MIIIFGDGQRPATAAYATWSIMALLTICSIGFMSAEPDEQREIFLRYGVSPPLWIVGNLRATAVDFAQLWQLVSATMIQPGFLTLAGNAALLWAVGDDIEHAIGRLRFFLLFAAGCVVGLLAAIVSHSQSQQPILGAFGGVGAVLGAFTLYRPRTRLRVLIVGRGLETSSWLILLLWLVLTPFALLFNERPPDPPIAAMIQNAMLAGVLTGVTLAPLLWRDPSSLLSEVVSDRIKALSAARTVSIASFALLAIATTFFVRATDREQIFAAAGDIFFKRAEHVVVRTFAPGPIVKKWLEASVDLGNARAAATLGWMFESPWYSGLEADLARAEELYGKVGGWGKSDALAAPIYASLDKGFGLNNNDVRWIRPAAAQGDARAQFIVAAAYRDSIGMPKDLERARHWARRSADQGYEASIQLLAELDASSK